MRLKPEELKYGVHPEILKHGALVLRKDGYFDRESFCQAFSASLEEIEPVLIGMLEDGYILPLDIGKLDSETKCMLEYRSDRDGINDFSAYFMGTQLLNQLAVASITDGFSREVAEELMGKVLAAARHVNAHPEEYTHQVTKLIVFGSYLRGEVETLGDLDIGFEIERLDRGGLDFDEIDKRYNKVKSKLRCKKPKHISLHYLSDIHRLDTPFKVVFEEPLK